MAKKIDDRPNSLNNRGERFKLYFSEEKYSFNAKKNATTCFLKFKICSPLSLSDNNVCKYIPEVIDGVYEDFTAVGVSKCNPKDNFDSELGKKIAKAKAENKAYYMAHVMLRNQILSLSRITKVLTNMNTLFEDKAKRCIDHNIEYIDRIAK